MKAVKNYFKAVLMVFGILYIFYAIFELLILKSSFNLIDSFIKVLLLAALLPLFSKKYIAQAASPEESARFSRNRKIIYIYIGGLAGLGLLLFFIFILINKGAIK